MSKRTKTPSGRYFMSAYQMAEAKYIEDVKKSKMKRGEIKDYNLYQCGCGCGVF